jgi:hypothetical protein
MSDGVYLLLAAALAVVFVLAVFATNPVDRNPHVNARRRRWHVRKPR